MEKIFQTTLGFFFCAVSWFIFSVQTFCVIYQVQIILPKVWKVYFFGLDPSTSKKDVLV